MNCLILVLVILHLSSELWAITCNSSLDEPFYFKFGPQCTDDTFLSKSLDHCSEETLSQRFSFGNIERSTLFVCVNGIIAFDTPVANYSTNYFETSNHAMIAPFFADVYLVDNFIDYMCVDKTNYEVGTDSGNWYEFERICGFYHDEEEISLSNEAINFREDYIPNETIRDLVSLHENKVFHRNETNVTFDDDISRLVFGQRTTKYVNLANNVFKREMSDVDLNNANALIANNLFGISFDWGYVVTWYKVSAFPGRLDGFNSFQAAIACGVASEYSQRRCFSIFDFFELEWVYNNWQEGFSISGFNGGNGNFHVKF